METEWVDVVFSAASPQYDAKVGDRLSVPADEVPRLLHDGVAAPATKSEAKAAGLEPGSAATSKK